MLLVHIHILAKTVHVVFSLSIISYQSPQLYVDNKELFRTYPPPDEIFNPFSAQFHKSFTLPDSKYNGHHRISIDCYARTPLGAKNMVVDSAGGRFRQYEFTVDGLSFFAFPAMFELGTTKMWGKVEKWGLKRLESIESGEGFSSSSHEMDRAGRLQDEYYFDKAKKKQSKKYGGGEDRYGQSISKQEYRAMNPRSENDEERMTRIALEASLRDLDNQRQTIGIKDHSPVKRSTHQGSRRNVKSEGGTPQLAVVGEDENLIDFGDDSMNNLARGVSQIAFAAQNNSSDVSVLGDDDATTASFMVKTTPMQSTGQQQPYYSQQSGQYYQQPMQHQPTMQTQYQDPTFAYAPSTPRGGGFNDAASFAYAPPPTWDDYNNAFGGGMSMNGSVAGGSVMQSPASTVGMSSPINSALVPVPQQQQYGGQYYSANVPQQNAHAQWQSQSYGAPPQQYQQQQPAPPTHGNVLKSSNMFDPLRSDPFAS